MGLRKTVERDVTDAAMAVAGLRAFLRIAEAWKLSADEQVTLLGAPARSTYFKWKRDGTTSLPCDVLERISYVVGIYKSLQILLPDADAADAWVRRENSASPFGGRSALERMLAGNVSDLYEVRRYLDAERGS